MDEREKKYLDMIARFPESSLGHFTLGKYYIEVGRYAEAIGPLERCLSEDPDWTAAAISLADALIATGRRERAIELLERARTTSQAKHGAVADAIAERLDDLKS